MANKAATNSNSKFSSNKGERRNLPNAIMYLDKASKSLN